MLPLLVIPYPVIDPVLLQLGPFALRWYALGYIAGIVIGWWFVRRLVTTPRLWGGSGSPMTARDIDDFVVWATIGIVAGGRIGYVLVYDFPRFTADPLSIVAVWEGGMSFHGGFLGTALAMVLFALRRGIPVWSLIDVIAAAAPVGIFLVRVANFINGELYGRAADVPWAMVFPNGGPEPRHPSQLYEAALEGLALFLVLLVLIFGVRRLRNPGFIAAAFTAGYGVARTFVEFFREPDVQIGFLPGGLTMGMMLSIPMIIAGGAVMIWSARRGPVDRPPPIASGTAAAPGEPPR